MAKRIKPAKEQGTQVKRASAKKYTTDKTLVPVVHEVQGQYMPATEEEIKNQRLELRLTKLQKDFISKASAVSGFKNVSDYILHIAIADSKNVIREQQLFDLSERDRVSFMKTLETPPAPGKNLKDAMAHYLSFQKGK